MRVRMVDELTTVDEYTQAIAAVRQELLEASHSHRQVRYDQLVQLHLRRAKFIRAAVESARVDVSDPAVAALLSASLLAAVADKDAAKEWAQHAQGVARQRKEAR